MNTDPSFLHISALTLLGAATIIGFYMGHVAQRVKLPSLIGYMIFGVILGPSILNLFDEPTMEDLSFLTGIALGFVAFTIGSELSLSSLKRLGTGIISIILAESFGAFFVVVAAVYLLTRDLPLSIIFGAMAPASAPAGTVAVIQEYKAKGSLTKALYAVVGFDDGLAIIIFGFAAALAKNLLIGEASDTTESLLPALWAPVMEIGLSLVMGGIIGFVFCQMVRNLQNSRDILIILFGAVFLATGLSIRWHLSLILTNMMVGFVLVNYRREALVQRVRVPLLEIMPLVFILFFCLAGANLKLSAIPALGSLGGVYILGRSAGLVGGARLGGLLGRVDEKVRKYVGMGILSQAGLAIGLALIVKDEFAQLDAQYNLPHAVTIGAAALTTITATCIFFEIIGPILTKFALKKAGEIPHDGSK
ncbi:MAG: cation:proton antiporter [Deltaproteobacteria bacterium]|nr:cation:proton antiporter [Deltaproteobacteria bacterium]MBW1795288.1 cation:proton antiporter [Deltaproteobacteria bacterium]MBW2331005.1 cation:proton antiporter [Deltaproteobacteria bacterium]